MRAYAEDVRARSFPTPEHTNAMKSAPKAPAGRGAARLAAAEVKATKKPKTPSSKG